MGKLIVLVIVAAVSAILWRVRIARSRRLLAELDDGTRCIACNGTELSRSFDQVQCLRCGYQANLKALRAAVVTEQELRAVTKPEERGTY